MEKYNIVLLGDAGVGKTALAIRFVQGQFAEDYDATIFDKFPLTFVVDGKTVDIQIHDTAGQGDYSSFLPGWIRHGHAFMLVYDLTDRESFQKLKSTYIPTIQSVLENLSIPVVLIGNKYDLMTEGNTNRHRQVSVEDAQDLSQSLNCTCIEASAKTRYNLSVCFETAVRQARKFYPPQEMNTEATTKFCSVL
jgi:GTPase KRas protein